VNPEALDVKTNPDTGGPAAGNPPLASVEGVSVRFGRRVIQENLSCSFVAGEFVAILGPNGAGKSTLLKLLLGLLKPSSGTVRIFGAPPRRGNRLIGYAPQFRVLESTQMLRARDVVGFGLDGDRWGFGFPSRKRSAAIDRALEEVGARELADAPVGLLSGGEQQRLLIAQALLTNPRLLLLDEPLANLDLAGASEVIQLVTRIKSERGVTVLFVTHDINPLLRHVDRVLYLANGRSLIGKPEAVINREQLSSLYGAPVEVVEALGRLFVVGVET
jgi:zinc/manganese transport system ATP-binding protein